MATSQFNIQVTGIGELEKAEQVINAGAGSVTNLRTQIKDLEKQLATLDPSSDKFVELSTQAGQLRDQLKNVKESVNANAAPAFERLGNNASLLTQKLSTLDFGGAAESVKLLAANVGQVNFKDLGKELTGFGKSMLQLGKALLTNPIFLLAAAIAAIIMNFDTLKSAIPGVNEALTGVSDEMTTALETSKQLTEQSKKQLDNISQSENVLKLQGKTEREILMMKIAAAEQALIDLKAQQQAQANISKAQIETAKRNKEIASGIIQFITAPLQILLATVDEVGKAFGKDFGLREGFNDFTSSLLFDPEAVEKQAKEAEQALADEFRTLENQQAGFKLSLKNMDKQSADEARKVREEENKKRIEEEKKTLDEIAKVREKYEAAQAALEQQRREAEFKANQERIRIADDQFALEQSLTLTKTEQEIAALVAKADKEFEIANGNAELEKMVAEKLASDIAQIQRKATEEELAREQAVQAAKIDFAQNALSTISEIVTNFAGQSERSAKRAFEINKGIAIAQTIIDTYKGAQAIFASAAANPASILFPAQPFISAGLAITAGLARVASIRSQTFQGSSSSGGGGSASAPSFGGGGGAAATPQFNALNPAFFNREQNNAQPPVRAYVLASNVTDAQAAQEKIQDQSTL